MALGALLSIRTPVGFHRAVAADRHRIAGGEGGLQRGVEPLVQAA
jgi:hypothetical protein